MNRLVIVSLFFYLVLGEPIVGGYKSKILFHPWLASIQVNDRHNCVGSIISENIILTAGHCVEKPANPYIVRVGSSRTDSNGSWHRVVAKKLHGKYSRPFGNSVNDVGLLKVSPSFQFGTNVKKVKLVEAGYEVTPGTSVNVAGWGSVSDNGSSTFELMSTNLFIVDSRDCSKAYGDSTGMVIRDHSLICAFSRNTDTCNGDSGAPLLLGDIQIGIVSMGVGCADPKYPGIYADVARYRSWIDANAN